MVSVFAGALSVIVGMVQPSSLALATSSTRGTLSVAASMQENPAVADVRKAAQAGDVEAQYNLAVMYDTGQGVPRDYAKAALWYRKAADEGMVRAQYNLALLYAAGLGVRRDDEQAALWYGKAAARGDALAEYNLAIMYENGEGVPRDYALALSWYNKAALQGHAPAMYNLGAMYYRGQGVGQNYVEAYKWRRLAADRAPVDKRQAYGDSVEAIIKVMTAEQLNEGVQRANDWATAFERELSTLDRTLPANSRKTAVAPIQTGQSFKSMTDVVEVETTVVDAGGRQVTDLLAREFQLKVDGHLRAVTSATYIAQPNVSSETSRMSTTERVNGGRYIVIAVDENNISVGAGHGAIQAAQRLVRSLPETDRVALFAVPTGTALDFTTDHARVLSALDRLVGRAPPSFSNFSVSLSELFAFAPSASPFDRLTQQRVTSRECHDGRSSCQDELLAEVQFRLQDLTERSHATLAALSALFSALSPMRGWKTVILISEGLALRPDASETNTVASLAARAATARVRLDSVLLDADLVDAADARLSPAPAQDRAVREDGLRDLTNRSDGTLAKIVGTANAAFDRLADELSGYYLLAFEVQEGDRDGRSHAIGVTTVRRGDTIRSRSRFVVPHP